jgi:hypothetical protein
MTMFFKLTLALLGVLLSVFTWAASNATTGHASNGHPQVPLAQAAELL